MKPHDLIIVGSGPAGLAVAIEARKAGLDYVVIDKGAVVNAIQCFPELMTFFSSADRLEIGGLPFPSVRRRPTRQEALEYYRRVADYYRLRLRLYEEVTDVKGQWPEFEVMTSRGVYRTRTLVWAAGFYGEPNRLNVPGEDLPHVHHYYTSPYRYYRRRVVIVGGGNSAVQAALETALRSAHVTMVVRDNDFHKSVKYWLLPDIKNRIAEGRIRAFFQSVVREITPAAVIIQTPDGVQHITADHVLALIGYRPDYGWFRRLGIQWAGPHRKPVYDPDTFESNVPGLYLAGALLGGLHTNEFFIENTRHHARPMVQAICGRLQQLRRGEFHKREG